MINTLQFFVVSVVFLLTWTTWQWMPHIFDSKWAYFVMTSLFFINNSINPTVYLIFNTQLRHELQHLLFQRSITMGSTKGNHTAARSESDRTTEMKLGTVLMSSLRKKQQKLSICQGRRTTEPSEHSILDSVMYQPLSRPFSDHAIRFIADDEVFDV
ncbi:hypothetical protein AB6A40_010209 [Gnathostoma spinigerum]|uniref:G-protein coupled receptors family 1 profile domain-containing protein n=1 Tax=Gnathostoma spinigerum TaxID=75299 RepID=A0ABD6EVH8_9BILA